MSGVAVVVPAYDEAPVIVDSVRSFLDLEYPDCEVIAVNVEFFLTFLLLAMLFGTLLSWLGVLSEVGGYKRYERLSEIARLLLYGVLENVPYRQWRTLVLWRGFLEFLWGTESWGAMERVGFDRER